MNSADLFTTRRLIAGRLSEAHLDDLLRMDGDPSVMDPIGGVRSEDATREYLQRNLDHWDEHGYGLWMLRLREGGRFAGRAYVRHLHIAESDEIAIGYALVRECWGMGLATEIATSIVDLGLSRLGIPSLVAAVRPDNTASRRVLEKVGFRFESETAYKAAAHLLYRIGDP